MKRMLTICAFLALGLVAGTVAVASAQEKKEDDAKKESKKGRGKGAGGGGFLSGVRKVGDTIYLSGAGSFSYKFGMTPTGMESGAYQSMMNLQENLQLAGYQRSDVVAAEVWITDMSKFQEMNRGYRPYFLKDPPTRTTVGVETLPPPPGDRGIAEIGLVAVRGEKKYIYPEGAAKGNLPFTPGILVGDTLYISGQASFDPKTGKLVEGDFKAHVKQTLKNIEAILTAGGMDFSNVVMSRVYLTDSGNFGAMNEVYNTFVKEPRPARVPIGVKSLPGGAPVEITMIAKKQHGKAILPEGMQASGNYSRGLLVGNELYISGVGSKAETVKEQVDDCMGRVQKIVEAGGMKMSDIVEARVYLTNIKDYNPMNDAYRPYFRGGPTPTRAAMSVPHLPGGLKVMMHFMAAKEEK